MNPDPSRPGEPDRPCACTRTARPVVTAVVRRRPRWTPAADVPPSS
ncbi:hypothetical protein [Geodermatophilus sp. URMC 62]